MLHETQRKTRCHSPIKHRGSSVVFYFFGALAAAFVALAAGFGAAFPEGFASVAVLGFTAAFLAGLAGASATAFGFFSAASAALGFAAFLATGLLAALGLAFGAST
ncbi:hypothetical protein [Caballeronia sp. M23-90]